MADKNDNEVLVNEKVNDSDLPKSKSIELQRSFKLFDLILISIIALLIGLLIGSLFLKQKTSTIYKGATNSELIEELISTMDTIKSKSYSDVTDEELISAAIKGMLGSLGDNYADYFSTSEANNFEIKMQGSYVGVGCEIANTVDGKILIMKVYDKTPASTAGLKAGDIVLEVDGKSVEKWTSDQLSNYIRTGDEIGTVVSIKVDRNGEEVILPLTRGYVTLTSAYGEKIERDGKSIGYIKVDLFALNTYNQFKDVLNKLESQNIDSLIIDVRDNSGGYLSVATSIISLFLDKNKVIYQLQDKDNITKVYSTSKGQKKYNIVVLTNENSASASEILAASLKESYGATLIGKTTYGKGTVQETGKLTNGSMIKYTIQNWLTPNGTWIEGKGYTPDIVVDNDEEILEKAIDYLKK